MRPIEKLADPAYVERLVVAHSGYRPRRARLYDFAREWQRLQGLPATARSAATDRIRQITVRTSLGSRDATPAVLDARFAAATHLHVAVRHGQIAASRENRHNRS